MSRNLGALKLQMMWEVENIIEKLSEREEDSITPDCVYRAFSGMSQVSAGCWMQLREEIVGKENE